MRRVPFALATTTILLALAGCLGGPEESGAPEPECVASSVEALVEGPEEPEPLVVALQEQGYAVRDAGDRTLRVEHPHGPEVKGVVSFRPGLRGGDLALDFQEERLATMPSRALTLAQDVAAIVNATYPEVALLEWSFVEAPARCGALLP